MRTAALAFCLAGVLQAGTFGTVVPIGGQAADIALDEARGVLYIANFGAGLVDVMNLADRRIQRSISVGSQPGSLAVSPDGRHLVVTQYGNFAAPNTPTNALTVIDLNSNTKQTFAMGNPPLAVAFGIDGLAFIATSHEFLLFDPKTGTMEQIDTVAGQAAAILPQPNPTSPSKIVAASIAVSGNGVYMYGLTDSFHFRYDSVRKLLRSGVYSSAPLLGPRAASVNRDGSLWMSGWTLNDMDFRVVSQYSNITGALETGSVLIDDDRGLVYAQMANMNDPRPVLYVSDGYNLGVRQRLLLQENLSGKSVLSSDGSTMYAASQSGVYILPVGQLGAEPLITSSKTELSFNGSFCDRTIASHEIAITSGGAPAAFRITTETPGIRITPNSGMTPATVRVTVDPGTFENRKGTTVATLKLESSDAVNDPTPIKVLINSHEPDQRGTVIPLSGKLVSVLADQDRDRFFILRQSTNEVLVYDGSTFSQVAALKTYATPTSMAITFDRRYLLVGNNDSHFINVYDLETLQEDRAIPTGDYVQSIAASAKAILASVRAADGKDHKIHRVDMGSRRTTRPASLGPYENKVALNSSLVATPNGRGIMIASADGTLMLYNAVQDTFVVSRRETTPLLGAVAASSYDQFVVGNTLLNASLVPIRKFDASSGVSSGFAFIDDKSGFRISAVNDASPGVLQRVDLTNGGGIRPTRTVEAPLLGNDTASFTKTLAPLYSRNAIVALTTSGFTVFPWSYDVGAAPPRIDRVVNAADFTQPVAPGGLITVFGSDLSPVSQSSRSVPLPTVLGDSCLTVNGVPVPVMYVSPRQMNAQLPFAAEGTTTLILRTPTGISDNFNMTISQGAPSIFRSGTAGPISDIPTVIRSSNNQVVTPSNPLHRGDVFTIYATGLGRTNPAVESGAPAPSSPLANTINVPVVTIAGVPIEVLYSGLVPGQIGVYQIDARVGGNVPTGFEHALEIRQGGGTTAVPVRVVQ